MIDRILAVFSDLHGGHKLGLMVPGTKVVDESLVQTDWGVFTDTTERALHQNPVQVFLADTYREHLIWLHKLANGRPIDVKINGDITQGRKYVREWVSTREADQFTIAYYFLKMLLELPTVASFGFIAGTPSHEMEEMTAPIILRERLQAETEIPIKIANHSLVTINGTVWDMAHHGPIPGGRRWLEGNGLRWYMNDMQQRELDLGRTPPDWVVRSHYHTLAHATSDYRKATTLYKTQGILTPGYTGMDGYGHQATRSKYEVHVGMVAWEIDANGNTQLRPKFKIIDTRHREVIE